MPLVLRKASEQAQAGTAETEITRALLQSVFLQCPHIFSGLSSALFPKHKAAWSRIPD